VPDIHDIELAISASNGNNEAFEKLVDIYFSGIVGVCFTVTGNIHDAEDCAQEAFLKAYRNIAKYEPSSSFFTWIYRIAVNTCYDLKRREKRRFTISLDESYENDDGAFAYPIEDSRPLPDAEMIDKLSDQRVREIIDSLPEAYSRILRLRDIRGLSYKEIAEIEQINEGTVKSRLARARAAFIQIASQEDLYSG
jgi:RNA polymerase sigma factor (sigma-70 family)